MGSIGSSSNSSTATRTYSPEDLGFRQGGQAGKKLSSMINNLIKSVGPSDVYVRVGSVGNGTITLTGKSGGKDVVGYSTDKKGSYLTWQGRRFSSVNDLVDFWNGKRRKSNG